MAERGQQIPPTSFRVDGGMAGVAHGGDPASSQGINTRQECLRVIRFALDYDVRQGRKKVTVVQKANVLKALTGIFLEAGRQVAKEYAGSVEMNDRIVDACTMQLVMNPWQFDVIVTTNLFGDILSDQMAGLVGGLGMAPGANIGETTAIFEAVHGSAPGIAGEGIANPLALLLAACLMLDHVGHAGRIDRIRQSIEKVFREDSVRTPDLGGKASTLEFSQAITNRVAA
jgi:isocitrate dehydrogenase (NAD+)